MCVERGSFEKDTDSAESGELVLVPPAVGLSTVLLNRDHHDEYYAGVPPGPAGEVLRRHGDPVECVGSSAHLAEAERGSTTPYYQALGRSDDTMNLGGERRVRMTLPGARVPSPVLFFSRRHSREDASEGQEDEGEVGAHQGAQMKMSGRGWLDAGQGQDLPPS